MVFVMILGVPVLAGQPSQFSAASSTVILEYTI